MKFNERAGGDWSERPVKRREGGEWVDVRQSTAPGELDGGFSWDQTFTNTDWLFDADDNDNLNVEVVTTLDYGASGGLKEAVNNADSYPTVVVFEVGGVIELGSSENFQPQNDEVWIAGETAPWPGISITRGRCRVQADRVIMTHVGVFPGSQTASENDSLVHEGDDVIFDHCSAMLSSRNGVAVIDQHDRPSVINTIIAEGLFDDPLHGEYRARGMLVNWEYTEEVSVMGCLWAHNNRRHPFTRADAVFVNNYAYNYANMSGDASSLVTLNSPRELSGFQQDVTAVGLRFDPGANTPDDWNRAVFTGQGNLYAEDIMRPDSHPLVDGPNLLNDPPLVPPGLDLENDVVPTEDLRDYTIANAGPRPADRAPFEQEFIDNRLEDPGGEVIDNESEVGGYPNYAQTSHTLNVPSTGIVEWIKDNYTAVVEGTAN